MIPRRLHRIVLPPLRATGVVEQYWTEMRKLHPDWDLVTWTDWRDIESSVFSDVYTGLRSPAQVADLMRLEILLLHGGLYVDADCEPVRALDPLLDLPFFLGTEDGWHLSTGVLGAEAGHPAIKAYIDAILRERRWELDVPPNFSTGPHLATHILGDRDDVTVLPPEMFYPETWASAQSSTRLGATQLASRHTYVVHRWAHSWASLEAPLPDGRFRSWVSDRQGAARALSRDLVRKLGRALPYPEQGSHASWIGDNRLLVRLPGDVPFLAAAHDLSLTPELATGGMYDRPFWDFLGRELRPGDHAVDVGANIGLFTLRMAKQVGRFGHVHAFEVNPPALDLLRRNIAMNWVGKQVTVHATAAGSAEGMVTLHADDEFLGSTRAGGFGRSGQASSDRHSQQVPVGRLDRILATRIPLSFVKVDVEGAEVSVLAGMRGLFDARCVRTVDLEVVRPTHPDAWLSLVREMRVLVEDYQATVSLLDASGLRRPTSLDQVVAKAGAFPHVLFDFPS